MKDREKSDFQTCHIVLLKILNFQQRQLWEIGNYDTWTGKTKKISALKNVHEEVQILDLINTEFKTGIKNMVKESKQSMCKKIKESIQILSHQIGDIIT